MMQHLSTNPFPSSPAPAREELYFQTDSEPVIPKDQKIYILHYDETILLDQGGFIIDVIPEDQDVSEKLCPCPGWDL